IHANAPGRQRVARYAGPGRAVEPVPLRAIVQAILRRATASLLDRPEDRARQGLAGRSRPFDHRGRVGSGLRSNEQLQRGVSPNRGRDADRLPPDARMTYFFNEQVGFAADLSQSSRDLVPDFMPLDVVALPRRLRLLPHRLTGRLARRFDKGTGARRDGPRSGHLLGRPWPLAARSASSLGCVKTFQRSEAIECDSPAVAIGIAPRFQSG